MPKSIDIFDIHAEIMDDYKRFVRSFIHINDEKIKTFVEAELDKGKFWPEPLIQFNPSFEHGESVRSLCEGGALHPDMEPIFKGYDLFRHQVEAIKKGVKGEDFVVTSGTGSGKSLTYLGTIFDHLLKNKTEQGIKAVIVYPMNALINSQYKAIENFKKGFEKETGRTFPITFEQYTGQQREDMRQNVKESPPDILLTNYMMLELILTRSREDAVRNSIYDNVKHLVFDELHTYRGRQGSDVAILIRRIKARAAHHVTCIGTSATMATEGTIPDQKRKAAEAAGKIFGVSFSEDRIIFEYLKHCFDHRGQSPAREELAAAMRAGIDPDAPEETLKTFPLSAWLENEIALERKEGLLTRRRPMRLSRIRRALSRDAGLDERVCGERLKTFLKWISNVNETLGDHRRTYLPYKIHQFISQTGSVYVSLDQGDDRIISLDPARHKGHGDDKIPLFPVVFSRITGHEFICVKKDVEHSVLKHREFREIQEDEKDAVAKSGYLITDPDAWRPESDLARLPDAWVRKDKSGVRAARKKYRDRLPQKIYFNRKGRFSGRGGYPYEGWFMPAKLLFDPTCGAQYDPKTSEATKLTRLGSEGRSTSTTVLAHAILRRLEDHGFEPGDQKLLSFTDNRQDAALQAGHFNDSLKVVRLRSAIYHALVKYRRLDYTNLDQAVFEALDLAPGEYAARPSARFPGAIRDNENALKAYVMYRALYDLRRGWRVVLPNLEQCGLMTVDYRHLEENCASDESWRGVPYIETLSHEERAGTMYHILDFFRKSYALASEEWLTQNAIDQKSKTIREKLKSPWTFDENEKIATPIRMGWEPLHRGARVYWKSVGPASALGRWIKEEARQKGVRFNRKSYMKFIEALLGLMAEAGWLRETRGKNRENRETPLYQLRVDQIVWKIGDGKTVTPDVVKIRSYKPCELQPNTFYRELYRTDFRTRKKLIGEEHTGQLGHDDRIERENKFQSGESSALFCSPTMELGVDIADLNVVHMRNAPPNPSNYAQRSGRAGRSGQAALIFTSCSVYSPHDSHYFKHASDLVSGVVLPPRIDLSNQELLTSHLHAIYLATVNLHEMNRSLIDLVDKEDRETLPLSPGVKAQLKLTRSAKDEIKRIFKKVVDGPDFRAPGAMPWLNDEWIDRVIHAAPNTFDRSMERWRRSYISAQNQLIEADRIMESGRFRGASEEMKRAKREARQAIRRRDLLENRGSFGSLSEFYPYRYLAAEGFLPGYNFTRLPIRAFIPVGDSGEYISRPRFIALREFGPRNIIYHKGAKYQIGQIQVQEAETRLMSAKVSRKSGYILMDEEFDYEVCPFSGVALDGGETREDVSDLIQMEESLTRRMDRISCEEEERLSRGFHISTCFSMPAGGMEDIRVAKIKNDDEDFLYIRFLPCARLVQINRQWIRSREKGFLMGMTTGLWKRETSNRAAGSGESAEPVRRVKLITHDTADALYIEPIQALGLDRKGVITLQYALKRAVENIFQVEPREIGAELMGDPALPNIFLYEASEGSLGILSRFIEDKDVFKSVVAEAIRLCRFDDDAYQDEASYDDLLSYYNQRYHDDIDRYKIRDALDKLMVCDVEIIGRTMEDYEEQYRRLSRGIDPDSETERRFLDHLHANGLKLPDAAQKEVEGVYCRPDFLTTRMYGFSATERPTTSRK